ncbi:AarF/ABC1/UbiB kinase family protein [Viridibacillus sp. YIM B01967]|uniref:AarF/ABC1/UbiB kinase family protein n=1 Tax=Viridibacillus soli TaxID=2798301 RepID=A0ABS1H812_9BACL|nr:AarF/UbiB family protein [Viridibacillus soli]MBK3495563.1 AarF/ABC1/UbiB kinase family protein [Viridibacillus soli]
MKQGKSRFRMWKILSFAFAMFVQVYWFRIRKKSDTEWERLWDKLGQQFRQLLFELEGLLIKVGQFLSIRKDLIPSGFIDQIQDLVDQVPPSPWEEIKSVMEREWGGSIENVLLSVESKAVASASIGEVYRGKLKDGTEVAIKVQRPSIPSIMRTDFRSLAIIIWFAQHFAPIPKGFLNFNMLFKELKYVIERELDFQKELETIQHFQQRFESYSKLNIPKVYPDISTQKVLVMEWIDGVRITDVDFLDKSLVDREELSQRLMRIFLPQWLEAGVFHADPHAGNVLVKSDGTIVLLDFGMVGEISKKDAINFQNLMQAILLKNYAQAAEILGDLGFLLPEANLKTIQNLLKEVLTMDLNQLKEMDLLAVKKEMNDMVKLLPIQVPTRFIFLGRSFVTIEGMLLTISPNKEILEIVKPVFMDWLNQSNSSKWKFFLKWINALPIFQVFHSIQDLLETPQRLLVQKETLQQREFYFSIYENQKKQMFIISVLGFVGISLGIYFQYPILSKVSVGLMVISFIGYFFCSWRQRKWLKLMDRKSKH